MLIRLATDDVTEVKPKPEKKVLNDPASRLFVSFFFLFKAFLIREILKFYTFFSFEFLQTDIVRRRRRRQHNGDGGNADDRMTTLCRFSFKDCVDNFKKPFFYRRYRNCAESLLLL